MFLTYFLILTIGSLTASAQILPCLNGDHLALQLDGEVVNYYGVEAYFKFDRKNLEVSALPGNKFVAFKLGETGVIFRGTADKNPEKNSVNAEILISAKADGVGKLNGENLSDCYVTLTEVQSSDHQDVPEKFKKRIFDKVSLCLRKELCPAIGNIKTEEIKRIE